MIQNLKLVNAESYSGVLRTNKGFFIAYDVETQAEKTMLILHREMRSANNKLNRYWIQQLKWFQCFLSTQKCSIVSN
jgi:hypothetical protein